jgi:predicted MFS family arabinose efflux permease
MGQWISGPLGQNRISVNTLAALALCWQAFTLPKMQSQNESGSAIDVFRLLGSSKVSLGMASVAFYLKDVLTRLLTQRASEITQLLPHSWTPA